MVFVNLFLDLFFTETILFPVPLFLLLQLLDCIFTQSGKLHPLMNADFLLLPEANHGRCGGEFVSISFLTASNFRKVDIFDAQLSWLHAN
jgi:hypothetical protein